ncbi:hypothetical protein [Deinococcus soli (ex Cha et al. 2016)]|uniref:hypothetical protein n=1 Tax=Deinococcus soli (ex Cha et al. 2016) TaxID=1309411 RepID=UPI0016637264|nr:hypothetical protein [Deinococcus soli (ex Cha et al. 2016)]GGB79564.1 hypothetical protein GCM10008019_39760 [Deinococcus soli (ex Cha et al. 2016)]
MNRTILLDEHVTLKLKPVLNAHEELRITLITPDEPAETLAGHFTVGCRVHGERVTPLDLTAAAATGAAPAGTLIQKALRAGADVLVLRGVLRQATFTIREVDLHLQPGKVPASAPLVEARHPSLLARFTQVARDTFGQLLPPAGVPLTLDSGHTLTVQHALGGGHDPEHTAITVHARKDGVDVGAGGIDAAVASALLEALVRDQPFTGRDRDADAAGPRVTFDPEAAELHLEVYADTLTLPVTPADRQLIARHVLGALTSHASPAVPAQDGAA